MFDWLVRVFGWVVGVTVVGVALQPVGGPEVATGLNLTPFSSISMIASYSVAPSVVLRNIAGNIALFVPVGVAGVLVFRRRSHRIVRATLAGALLSLLIEVAQFTLPLGRVTDVDDLVLNTAGAWLGAVLAAAALGVVDRKETRRTPPGPRMGGPVTVFDGDHEEGATL